MTGADGGEALDVVTPSKTPLGRRRAHYLTSNDRSETIHQCVFYDCETTRYKGRDGITRHVLEFGWAAFTQRTPQGTWSKPKWYRFTKGKELWKWITGKARKKRTLYVWAHNQYFDYTSSLGAFGLTGLGWTLKNAIVDSPPFVMTYKKSSMRLILADTLNIWRMSLKEMGRLTGLEKLDMPAHWGNGPTDDDYCKRDVEIILKAVTEWADFLVSQDLGKFCLTIASQSMQTFRHRYLEDRILIDTDEQALDIARKAYRGGRVECYRIGKLPGPLWMLDINSLYPFCMATYEFPLRLIAAVARPSIADVKNLLQKYLLCAEITCTVREPVIAVKEKGKLIFPVGTFKAYVSTPELAYLLEQDAVVEVHRAAIYEKGRPFTHFAEDLYQRRVEALTNGDTVKSGHYKLLLNSFSGKWGQNGIKWSTLATTRDMSIGFFRSVNPRPPFVVHYRRFNGLIQRRDTFPESSNSHPAIAAHITGYGRMVLWALMRKVTPEHYLYCDTDSLLVSREGLELVKESIDDKILGAPKVVFEAQEFILNGPKDYIRDGARTIKGIREQAIELSSDLFRQERFVGFRGALRKGWTDAPRTLEITKKLRRIYSKGVVVDGGRVLPLHRDGTEAEG